MFKNLKIGTRLAIGFGLVVSLMILIGAIGILRLAALDNEVNLIVGDRFPKTVQANEVVNAINTIARSMRNILLENDKTKIDKEIDRIEENRKIISDRLERLDKSITTDAGKELLRKLTDARTTYVAGQGKFMALVKENKHEEAKNLLLAEIRATQRTYIDSVNALIEYQTKLMTDSGKAAESMAEGSRNLIIMLLLAAISLAVFGAIWITRSITRPVIQAAEASKKMAKGDFQFELKSDVNDEVGDVVRALESVKIAVKRMVDDADLLAQAAVAGKLSTRADASKHEGDFQVVVKGVNNTLDAVIGPLNVTADYVDKIAKGVIPPIITDNYNGDFNIIKNNLNAMVKMMSDLLAQTDIIIKGAADGDLDKRANAEMFVGGWNQLVKGVNEAITNIVNPLNVTADYVDKVAKGVIPPTITTEYKGQYNLIKINLNNMVKMMSELLAQTDIIIKGAAAGELDKRANADLFVGGWNQLVTGVNEAITNIVDPLNVTADYVDKVAKGVIPPTITTEYKGQYNLIKINLNAMVKMMSELLQQTDIIIKGAAAGELKKRANADMFVGGWNQLVKGVNEAITNIVNPLNVTADYVDRISKGDIPPKITDPYSGDYNIIKNNLNTCITAVNALVADANTLSAAAVAGRLETRADASKHQGDFRKIVQGVNDTLDAVIGPINDVQRVMGAMEQGDITESITRNYQGDFDTLKTAINNTIAKLAEIIAEVRGSANNLTSAAGQISSTSQSLSQASSEQAASVEETSASIEEMSASVNQNAENAKLTDNMATKSSKEATEGGTAVNQTVEAMKSIAGKIGIIDDIAYQTNLLALNAAIEAARAGEHGKGFAVVAAEVRKLAERSQVAAQEIGELASSSVKLAEKAGHLLDEMVPSIQKTSDLVQEIAAASNEQSSGITQINGAMSQLSQITQQNASASEELAATAEEMSGQSEQLQQLMAFFKLAAGSGAASGPVGVRGQSARNAPRVQTMDDPGERDFVRF
jgi:methyl-accepting chemotaxis protein